MSELKVNTISEVTGANGVVIDSVKLKDGGIVISDAANIGSASDVDAIAIGSDGDITLTQDLELQHDGAILSFGANDEVSLTHVHDTGILLNSTNVIQFNDASQNIGAPSNAILDINATDEIELNATLLDVNANLDVSGTTLLPTAGIITAKDLGVGLHIRTADSGGSVQGTADELVIEGSAHNGITFLTGTTQTSTINFGDSGDNDIGIIEYNHNTDIMHFYAGANHVFKLKSDQVIVNEDSDDVDFRVESGAKTHHFFLDGGTNDGAAAFNDSAPETGTGGITLNQTSLDNSIISLKSNDIAHSFTAVHQNDTYGDFRKAVANDGGLQISGVTEGQYGVRIKSLVDTSDVNGTVNANNLGAMDMDIAGDDGTGVTALGNDKNIFTVSNNAQAKFIITSQGTINYDGSDAGAYDTYEDAQMVRAFDLSHGRGVINSKFDKFISYNHEKLAEMKLVGREDDGTPNHFISLTGMQALHNGAIWQQYEKHNQLLNAFYKLAEKTIGKEEADKLLETEEIKRLN